MHGITEYKLFFLLRQKKMDLRKKIQKEIMADILNNADTSYQQSAGFCEFGDDDDYEDLGGAVKKMAAKKKVKKVQKAKKAKAGAKPKEGKGVKDKGDEIVKSVLVGYRPSKNSIWKDKGAAKKALRNFYSPDKSDKANFDYINAWFRMFKIVPEAKRPYAEAIIYEVKRKYKLEAKPIKVALEEGEFRGGRQVCVTLPNKVYSDLGGYKVALRKKILKDPRNKVNSDAEIKAAIKNAIYKYDKGGKKLVRKSVLKKLKDYADENRPVASKKAFNKEKIAALIEANKLSNEKLKEDFDKFQNDLKIKIKKKDIESMLIAKKLKNKKLKEDLKRLEAELQKPVERAERDIAALILD